MSETTETTSTEADDLAQAVAVSHASPAPTNPLEQMFARLHQRVAGIETKVQAVEGTVNDLADVATAVAPSASVSHWVSAFQRLEDLINGVIAAFEGHFQGKIVLPAPTDGAITANLSTADPGKVRLGAMSPSLPRVVAAGEAASGKPF